jgi:hypothetical protein
MPGCRNRWETAALALGLGLSIPALSTPARAQGVPADTKDPRVIMVAVDKRDEGDKISSNVVMKLFDSEGRERSRSVQIRSVKFPEGRKQLLIFEEPANVRNTSFLSFDYSDGDKDDDQWLYLPALKKTNRIASSEKDGSFMGTDLSYSDMTKQDPKNYDFTLLEASAKVDGEDCWVIEAKPKTDKIRAQTGYMKSQLWVSKSKLMQIQSKNWIEKGKRLKLIKYGDIKNVAGVWAAHQILAQTMKGEQTESKTAIVYNNLKMNDKGVVDDDFTQRRLEKGL